MRPPSSISGADASAAPARPGPGSVAWQIHRERLMLLSWGRAILLQLAHPLVAAGVAEHSQFGGSPAANRHRLERTVRAMLTLTFGDPAPAGATGRRIDGIHGQVTGSLGEATGRWAAGTPYAARMPELLRWVYATMLDSSLLVYNLYIGPLSWAAQDQYCREARAIGPLLGLPVELIPASRNALDEYIRSMYTNRDIAVGESARQLMRQLLRARPYAFIGPRLLNLMHLPTIGLLPPAIREGYGLDWHPSQERLLRLSQRLSRALWPLAPAALREWPIARTAAARAAGGWAAPSAGDDGGRDAPHMVR